eukprot:8128944-Pyramimonas_sp.AAC.1
MNVDELAHGRIMCKDKQFKSQASRYYYVIFYDALENLTRNRVFGFFRSCWASPEFRERR